jgi:hypothetical protein
LELKALSGNKFLILSNYRLKTTAGIGVGAKEEVFRLKNII